MWRNYWKFILCCIAIIKFCAYGFTDEDMFISTCRLKCRLHFDDVDDKFFCDHNCQVNQCFSGCSLYTNAVNNSPCSSVCSDWLWKNMTDTEQLSSVMQIKKHTCIQGCNFGLDEYYRRIVTFSHNRLEGPLVVKDNITHNSVELYLIKDLWLENFTYILQQRILETHSEWQRNNYTELLPSRHLVVSNLYPFLTYKFRLIFKITTAHDVITNESYAVTTLPFGAPSSSPTLTSIRAPSATAISISWTPPVFTNGPLIGYHLTLHPFASGGHVITVDVSHDQTSWIFNNLLSGQKYDVHVAAVNIEGMGPYDARTVETLLPDNLSGQEQPYLILGTENLVVKQRLTDLIQESEKMLKNPKDILIIDGAKLLFQSNSTSELIRGVGVHVGKGLVLVSDNGGHVTMVGVESGQQAQDIYPMLPKPTAIDVDWLNNYAYIVEGHRIYQCTIKDNNNQCVVALNSPNELKEVKVDPINGFLYFTFMDSKMGLHCADLDDITPQTDPIARVLINLDIHTFHIDHENLVLYFPDNKQNTIMAAYLDGTGVKDIRKGLVAEPYFRNTTSLIYYDGKFFWTNGSDVFSEQYDVGNRTIYHHTLPLLEKHFTGFNMYNNHSQPLPVPVNPPSNVQALLTAYKAIIEWKPPERLAFQGSGAYNKWQYEISILQTDGSWNQFYETLSILWFEVQNLEPDTKYEIKIRAKYNGNTGPWSQVFHGRTLKKELDSATLIFASKYQYRWEIKEVGMDGIVSRTLEDMSSTDAKVTDLAWYGDNLIWTTGEDLVLLKPKDESKIPLSFARDVSCVVFDWLGERLYWSIKKNGGVIKRADLFGKNEEFVYQAVARDMTLDGVKGRLYWVTLTSVETTYLNGNNHSQYYSLQMFSGKHVISVTIDHDQQKLMWYVKGFEDQSLYMADLYDYQTANDNIIGTVQLVGKIHDIDSYSPIQYFSHHLLWIDSNMALRIGDTACNYSSTISAIQDHVSMFAIRHSTLQQYPDGLNSTSVRVIPLSIPPESITCSGVWSSFNLTWKPSTEVNHGTVMYELSLQAEGTSDIIQVTNNTWYPVEGLMPYVQIVVSVRGYTYWGSGSPMVTVIKSPMAAPGQPQAPKVYVTQRKNAALSKVTQVADFRWSQPGQVNGIMIQQNVYLWQSDKPETITATTLAASARHFVLEELETNVTYFFQVECCTVVGCGPRSQAVNATATFVNPVPKIIVSNKRGICVAESENIENTSVTLTNKSVVAISYLSQDDVYYWITREKTLEEFAPSANRKLMLLEGDGHQLTLDWVSRSLYIVDQNSTGISTIRRYDVDEASYKVILERPAPINDIVVDPFTSTFLWTELDVVTNSWQIMAASTNNNSRTWKLFHHDICQHQDTRRNCSCCRVRRVLGAITVDVLQDGRTEVIFVNGELFTLIASEMYGCNCRTLLTTTAEDRKGLPADYMTVDHVFIYWYHSKTKRFYAMEKVSMKLITPQTDDITDILGFGSHLQPLPGSECLDTSPYTVTVDIISFTNTSVVISLREIPWPESCSNISHPAVKYTSYYRQTDGEIQHENCQTSMEQCKTKDSYSREVSLTDLEPYTYYIIQGAVSNYFTQYSSISLGETAMIRTKPGVPSPVTNIEATPSSPNSMIVTWLPPWPPNGPIDKIVYFVKWATQLEDGTSHVTVTDAITYKKMTSSINDHFTMEITTLAANTIYTLQIICNQTDGGLIAESMPIEVHTFEDLKLKEITNTSILLSWHSPCDDSVYLLIILCDEYKGKVNGQQTYTDSNNDQNDTTLFDVDNCTLYNETFTNLKPNTEYAFMIRILYKPAQVFIWPKFGLEQKYVFRTLSGIPAAPDPPDVELLKSGEYEVSWYQPKDNGEQISQYLLQYRPIDKENWTVAYNTTMMRWIVDDGILQKGYTYVFRVKAKNKHGWGQYSLNSSMFFYPILETDVLDGTYIITIIVVCAFIFVVVVLAFVAFYLLCRRHREEKKSADFITVARGPDLELATLRELPTTTMQHNNTLYAMNIVPTDDEIAALPHFRRDQLVLCKFLGSGAFGEVFEGLAKNIINESSGDTSCAVKTLRKSASDQEKDEFLKEALLMSHFRHEHILSLLGVCLDNDPQFIILELMDGGDLLSFLRASRLSSIVNQRYVDLSLTDLVKICVHVASGCKYLEDMHFVHRDLAARNCLVSSCNPNNMVVKIGDFGLARDIYKNDYYRKEGEGLMPVRWMSPESLVDAVFTTQSDIWAFGVLMWEVVTFGQQPYPARTNIEVLHFVRSGGRLDRPDNCPEDLYQLMCKCWSFSPEDRPSFKFLLWQLEKFHDTCASVSDYLVPIHQTNRPLDAVAGCTFLTQRSRKLTSLSSLGHDNHAHSEHTPYGSHKSYGNIRKATSFDTPEPTDATHQIQGHLDNYLDSDSSIPLYIEFLPENVTQNYVYNSYGERIHDKTSSADAASQGPVYVQTIVKENFDPSIDNCVKYVNHKGNSSSDKENYIEVKRIFLHQKNSADSVIMKTMENIPCAVGNGSENGSMLASSNVIYARIDNTQLAQSNKKMQHFRKQRLDSGNSVMSFDSVQTEPAYTNHSRSKLYSSSSSKSNYSMTNISESMTDDICIEMKPQQYWANTSNDHCNIATKGHHEVKGHLEYFNMLSKSQVYPEHLGALAGYDIVHASLV